MTDAKWQFTRKFLGEEIADTIFMQSAIRDALLQYMNEEYSEKLSGDIMDMILTSPLCKEKYAEFYETVKRNHAMREGDKL